MRGYEVIFKFLMISFKTPIESRFSWNPFTISLIPPPPPYGYPACLVPLDRYFQGASGRGSYVAHGPFSTNNVGIYRNMASNTYCQYISTLSEVTPIWTFPLPLFKFYDSSPSILCVLEVVLR